MAFTIIALSLLKALDWLFTPLPVATDSASAAAHMCRIISLITPVRISPTRMRRTRAPQFPSLHRLFHLELGKYQTVYTFKRCRKFNDPL